MEIALIINIINDITLLLQNLLVWLKTW